MVEHFAATWLGAPDRSARGATPLAERTAGTRPYGSCRRPPCASPRPPPRSSRTRALPA
ncbi:hypothetical protein ACRAWD_18045 [Caulobacter segnis]